MRIVFMGTPDFAATSLERIIADGHDVAGVFTQPDKPKNRGHKLAPPPVKQLAERHGIPVFQPATLKDDMTLQNLRNLRPELIAVIAYGKLLSRDILDIPPLGCINIHGSLLPKYRGAAPVQWAVLNGETTTGVTAMYMSEELDAGDIVGVRETDIGRNETAGELMDRLSHIGAELLGETVAAISRSEASRTQQKHEAATFAPPLRREQSPIDWTRTAREIACQVRGLNPWPVATAELCGTVFKIFAAHEGDNAGAPGDIITAGNRGLEIACSDGSVVIDELSAPGGKRMAARDYLRGHPICL